MAVPFWVPLGFEKVLMACCLGLGAFGFRVRAFGLRGLRA